MLESDSQIVLDQIDNFRQHCFDIETTADKLTPLASEPLQFFLAAGEDEENQPTHLLPNQSAEGQFLTKIKVPVGFFHRCPIELKQQILDYFNTDRDYLLRCYINSKYEHICRAVLSSVYTRAYDNYLVFPVVLDALKDVNLELRKFMNDGVITRMEVLLNKVVDYEGRKIRSGLMITNSETGHSSLWIEPIVVVDNYFLFACRANLEYSKFRQIHKGQGVEKDKIAEMVKEALRISQVGVIQYMENLHKPIKQQKAIDFAKNLEALPNRFVIIMEQEWALEQELKKEKVIRDILTAAAELPILNRIQIEQSVGNWMGMFHNYEDRFTRLEQQAQEVLVNA